MSGPRIYFAMQATFLLVSIAATAAEAQTHPEMLLGLVWGFVLSFNITVTIHALRATWRGATA